jgi:DNA-binding response OmpR family regulator
MRILVVEDEHKLAAVLKRGLEEHGYAVDVVYDGEAGLHLAEVEPYDLVVLDVMLPLLDGCEVCRRLRVRRRNMPVLMLTARDAVDDRVAGLDAGADDYLVKPFAFRELLARVRALLRRDGLSRDPVLRVADLEVDTVSHEVRRAGRAVTLTSKEYAILEYFMRHPNRVLTRTQIAEHVWDYDFVSMSNVVDVYLGYLRRKLGDDREPRLLRTIRGTGYQLKVPQAEAPSELPLPARGARAGVTEAAGG